MILQCFLQGLFNYVNYPCAAIPLEHVIFIIIIIIIIIYGKPLSIQKVQRMHKIHEIEPKPSKIR